VAAAAILVSCPHPRVPATSVIGPSLPEQLAKLDYRVPQGPVPFHVGDVVEVEGPTSMRVVVTKCIMTPPHTFPQYSRVERTTGRSLAVRFGLPQVGGSLEVSAEAIEQFRNVATTYIDLGVTRDPGSRTAECTRQLNALFELGASELRLVTEIVTGEMDSKSKATVAAGIQLPTGLAPVGVGASGEAAATNGTTTVPDIVLAWKWDRLAPGGRPTESPSLVEPDRPDPSSGPTPGADAGQSPSDSGQPDPISDAAPDKDECPMTPYRAVSAPWSSEDEQLRVYWTGGATEYPFGYVFDIDEAKLIEPCTTAPPTAYVEIAGPGYLSKYAVSNSAYM
jgi:hypothetical protein